MNKFAQNVNNPPLAVGIEEGGRMTGHSRSAMYGAIAKGELASFKSGKRRLILVSELENWLEKMAGKS